MKTLKTGVVITYDKKGNIKDVYSPYYTKENNATRGTLLNWRKFNLKNLLKSWK